MLLVMLSVLIRLSTWTPFKLTQKIEIPLRRVQPIEHLISVQNVPIVTVAFKVYSQINISIVVAIWE
uniref:Putative ovule protein n=1 Tax=Solanum chacoense TaxID=4108 RepID=A0A0V0HJA0_SOLCH